MSTFSGGPNIVTDGLVLYLDAANNQSYPRSGTRWNDLSKNSNHGTLVNGPTFNSNNGGSIAFDGVNDYASIGDRTYSTSNSFTLNIFFNVSKNAINSYASQPLFSWGPCRMYIRNATNEIRARSESSFGASEVSFPIGLDNFGIFNACVVYSGWSGSNFSLKLFVNGKLVVQNSFSTRPTYDFKYYLGIYSELGVLTGAFQGRVFSCQVYSKELSSTEILQNYNATKSRFGL